MYEEVLEACQLSDQLCRAFPTAAARGAVGRDSTLSLSSPLSSSLGHNGGKFATDVRAPPDCKHQSCECSIAMADNSYSKRDKLGQWTFNEGGTKTAALTRGLDYLRMPALNKVN